MADITSPPLQHTAATKPALRGPACSSQPPNSAAELPRITKNSVYIQPKWALTTQSQVVANTEARYPMSAGQVTGLSMPTARDSGSQNTLKP